VSPQPDDSNRFKFKSYSPRVGYRSFGLVKKILIGLAILVFAVLIIRQINHTFFATTTPTSPPETAQGAGSTQPTKPKQPKASSKPAAVPNTGPGNIAAVFLGVSALAAGGHYLIAVRRS
jgi:hypothetical protein